MSTDTSSALDQPTQTAPTPKPPRDKVMRIATMTKQLLDEVRTQPLDAASLDRLRTIDTQSSVSCSPISPPTYAKNCSGSHCR